ncbi:MAG TPA: AraC family transcriptional regulator [Ruminiclostridium sp.]
MNVLKDVKQKFPESVTVHRTLGKDYTKGVLSCGFLRKPKINNYDMDIEFKYYGALLILQGTGMYIDEEGSQIQLYPGCFVQRLPGRKHSTPVFPDGNWIETFLCFGRDLCLSLQELGLINSEKPVLKPGLDYILIEKFIYLFEQLRNAPVNELPLLLLKAQEIIIRVNELDRQNVEGNSNHVIEEACKIINESNGKELSGQDLAGQLNIGYENFRKLFKQKMGVSPNFHIIQTRVNAAKALLLTPNKNISEIALELGYSDYFSFEKQFKKVVGKSPTEFRKEY